MSQPPADKNAPASDASTIPGRQGPPEHPDPFRRLAAIMARLRAPDGCPWDQKQTHESLRQYALEEVHELIEAIDEGDDKLLREELGDVMLQVVFHAQLAAEADRFDIDAVCEAICAKLIRRHPHVFGDIRADSPEGALRNWERIKAAERAEKADTSAEDSSAGERVFAGVPKRLPALLKASRLQEKAACVGFDWPDLAPVLAKIREELAEWEHELRTFHLEAQANPHLPGAKGPVPEPPPAVQEEFGDLLFALVNASRFLGINAEEALQSANRKFMDRFGLMSRLAEADGSRLGEMTLDEMDRYWEKAKLAKKAALAEGNG
jgi:MazG family protein